jgi:diacylglycerol kinase family enzyme
VERFDLVDRCVRAGIDPIVLAPGDDLLTLAETAVAQGADLIGMAGGDGSQALVASVASKHRIPFVVVPAGTRNHIALDLGIDRDDVPASLEALREGVDKQIDLAEVNDRVFVNNAAMGVYASIVQSQDYRNAKVQTAAAMLPDLLDPSADRSTVTYRLPSGEEESIGQLLLVSNNPYRLRQLRGGGQRTRLDGGVLGAVALTVSTAADVQAVAALELAGRIDRYPGWREWTPTSLDVHADRPVEIGVDGEALLLDPPLRFVCHPGALTIRLPIAAAVRAAMPVDVRVTERKTLAALWRLAIGRGDGRT